MRVGPYRLHGVIASGGFGRVEYATREGIGGFSRVVAVKRVRTDRLGSEEAAAMLLDEARIVSRIHHPNVVSVLDVVRDETELFVVMDYVDGETVTFLQRAARERDERVPAPIVAAIASQALAGLHAAHEARDEAGTPLGIVHRDVSPQNVMVGADGVARVLDFGIAKALGRLQRTATGEVKGKLAYMAPEQLAGELVTRASDLYGVGVILWELVTGRRLFDGPHADALVQRILLGYIEPPSKYVPDLPEDLERVILQALSRAPDERFSSAREMEKALTACVAPAFPSELGAWVEERAAESLLHRRPVIDLLSTSLTLADDASVTVREDAHVEGAVPHRPLPARRRAAPRVLLLAALLGPLVLIAVTIGRTGRTPPSAVVAVAPANAATSVAPLAPIAALEAVPPTASAAPLTAPSPSVRKPALVRRSKVTIAHDPCDIPFTVDAHGARTYKRECLGLP